MISYWRWFFRGSGGRPGAFRYFDVWLFFHLGLGLFLAWIVPSALDEAAKGLLLPVAGVFIGLSFAWGGNAQALLESSEILEMVDKHPGGFEEYIYTFQSAILFLLLTLVLWVFAGLGIFDKVWPSQTMDCSYFAVSSVLYFLASLSIRECWHVILGAQWFLLARHNIRKRRDETGQNRPPIG
jgi:hypothetical protein